MSTKQTSDRMSEARSTSAEQLSIVGSAATETFERIARQNHAIMGDMIDWTLASMRIPTRESDAKSVLEAQAAEARNFAGKARMRMQEYVDIAGGFGKRIAESPAGSEQVRRAVATATEQVHEAIENAGGTPDPMARATDAAAATVSQAENVASSVRETALDTAKAAADTASRVAADTSKNAADTADKVASDTSKAASDTGKAASDTGKAASDTAGKAASSASKAAVDTAKTASAQPSKKKAAAKRKATGKKSAS